MIEGGKGMRIAPKATLRENINELQAQEYSVRDDNQPVPDNISNPETQQYTQTYSPWGWYGIDSIKSAAYYYERDRMSVFGDKSLRGLAYLTHFFFFLPQIYIETVLIPQTSNKIKFPTISFEYFLSW